MSDNDGALIACGGLYMGTVAAREVAAQQGWPSIRGFPVRSQLPLALCRHVLEIELGIAHTTSRSAVRLPLPPAGWESGEFSYLECLTEWSSIMFFTCSKPGGTMTHSHKAWHLLKTKKIFWIKHIKVIAIQWSVFRLWKEMQIFHQTTTTTTMITTKRRWTKQNKTKVVVCVCLRACALRKSSLLCLVCFDTSHWDAEAFKRSTCHQHKRS